MILFNIKKYINELELLFCMETELVNVRLPKRLISQIETIQKIEGYASKQEFVKEATREHIQRKILALFGSDPRIKELSKTQRAVLLRE